MEEFGETTDLNPIDLFHLLAITDKGFRLEILRMISHEDLARELAGRYESADMDEDLEIFFTSAADAGISMASNEAVGHETIRRIEEGEIDEVDLSFTIENRATNRFNPGDAFWSNLDELEFYVQSGKTKKAKISLNSIVSDLRKAAR